MKIHYPNVKANYPRPIRIDKIFNDKDIEGICGCRTKLHIRKTWSISYSFDKDNLDCLTCMRMLEII